MEKWVRNVIDKLKRRLLWYGDNSVGKKNVHNFRVVLELKSLKSDAHSKFHVWLVLCWCGQSESGIVALLWSWILLWGEEMWCSKK